MNWKAEETKTEDAKPDAKPTAGGSHKGSVSATGNHIYFFKDVNVESIAELIKSLQKVEVEHLQYAILYGMDPLPIHLHIHSPGGDVFAGFAGVDAILDCRVPVHTHIDGMAASAATFLSMSGAHRTIGRHGYILVHQLFSVHWGKFEELKDGMANSTLLMDRMRAFYRERGKVPKDQLDEVLKHDLWWNAETALRYGLVDEIRGVDKTTKKRK